MNNSKKTFFDQVSENFYSQDHEMVIDLEFWDINQRGDFTLKPIPEKKGYPRSGEPSPRTRYSKYFIGNFSLHEWGEFRQFPEVLKRLKWPLKYKHVFPGKIQARIVFALEIDAYPLEKKIFNEINESLQKALIDPRRLKEKVAPKNPKSGPRSDETQKPQKWSISSKKKNSLIIIFFRSFWKVKLLQKKEEAIDT